jgi:hypothetical protein
VPVSVSIKRSSFLSLTNTPLKFAGGAPGGLNVAMAVNLEVTNTTRLSPGRIIGKVGLGTNLPSSRRKLQDRIYFEQHRAFHRARGAAIRVSFLVPQMR